MDPIDIDRRALLFGAGALGIDHLLTQGIAPAQTAKPPGYVLGPNAGEHLVHFRDHGQIFIKIGSATGSENLSLGTQQVTKAAGIPLHRHLQAAEAFYVLEGSGVLTLDGVVHPVEQGSTIFIPKNSWHGFTNPDHELLLLWVMSPAGLDGFFRETCSPPGVQPRQLTREQINAIALKYGTEFQPTPAGS